MSSDVVTFVFALAVPVVAIIGAFTVAIVRIVSEQRMIQLAQKERIAAIERGIDPSKLPPIGGEGSVIHERLSYRYASPMRRAQGLVIGGLVTLAVGIGTSVFLYGVDNDHKAWSVGLIPMLVGIALLAGAVIIWPRGNSVGPTPPGPPIP